MIPQAIHATHATQLTHVSKTNHKSLVLKRAQEKAVDNRRSAMKSDKECACGCGGTPAARAKYINGHNAYMGIKPAGMTYERAFEIALAVYDSKQRFESADWRDPRNGKDWKINEAVDPVKVRWRFNSGQPVGRKLSPDSRVLLFELIGANVPTKEICGRLRISSATVTRYRRKMKEGTA